MWHVSIVQHIGKYRGIEHGLCHVIIHVDINAETGRDGKHQTSIKMKFRKCDFVTILRETLDFLLFGLTCMWVLTLLKSVWFLDLLVHYEFHSKCKKKSEEKSVLTH